MTEPGVPVGEDAPILEVMATMRAMRRLKPDPVPDELLQKLVQAASWAPNGANRQAMEFVVVTDRDLIGRLAPLWARSVDAYLGSLGRVTEPRPSCTSSIGASCASPGISATSTARPASRTPLRSRPRG